MIKLKTPEDFFCYEWIGDPDNSIVDCNEMDAAWEEAQELGLTKYSEYKRYKAIFKTQDDLSLNKLVKKYYKKKADNQVDNSSKIASIKFDHVNNSSDKVAESLEIDVRPEINTNVRQFIQENQNLINDEEWDDLFELAEEELNMEEQSTLVEMLLSIGCEFEVLD